MVCLASYQPTTASRKNLRTDGSILRIRKERDTMYEHPRVFPVRGTVGRAVIQESRSDVHATVDW